MLLSAVVLATLCLAGAGQRLRAEDELEKILPNLRQQTPLPYETLRINNNAVFIGTCSETGNNRVYTLKVEEIWKEGDNGRKIADNETLDIQCYRGNLTKNEVYVLPIYLWGNNNPGVCNVDPIKLRRDFKNDPLYKVLKFTLRKDLATAPDAFTVQAWKLYNSFQHKDLLTDGRLDLLAFIAADHADRIDPQHAEWAAEMDRLLHQELLGDPELLKKAEGGDAGHQYRMEQALTAVTRLYARRGDLKVADELIGLLKASPLAIGAAYSLVERIGDDDKPAVAQALLPLIQAQVDNKHIDRRAVQVLYLARLAKSDEITALLKKTIAADLDRPDILLLARTVVAIEGEKSWETIAPVFDKQYGWENNNMQIESDLIKMTIDRVGKKAYKQLVHSIKKNPQLQGMIYQVFNGMQADAREEFGYELLEAGVHNVLPFMLQGTAPASARLMEFVLRYAVGEVQAKDDNERNLLMNATVNARQYLQNRLGCNADTRAGFNEWYLDKLSAVNLPLTDALKAKLADWQRDLSSPLGEVRQQAQKEISNLGADAIPALLQLEHTAKDLTTRQTARALILQQPLIAEAFHSGE